MRFLAVCGLLLLSLDARADYLAAHDDLAFWNQHRTGQGTAGDVDGDGFDGFLHADGSARLFPGSAAGLVATEVWTRPPPQGGAGFDDAAGAGDVDGDGFDDVILGAAGYDNTPGGGAQRDGRAFLYRGSASGLADTPAWQVTVGSQTGFGRRVAGGGDLDGDGYDDVAVGTDDASTVVVFLGGPGGLSTRPARTITLPGVSPSARAWPSSPTSTATVAPSSPSARRSGGTTRACSGAAPTSTWAARRAWRRPRRGRSPSPMCPAPISATPWPAAMSTATASATWW